MKLECQDEDLAPKGSMGDVFLRYLLLCRLPVTSVKDTFCLPAAMKIEFFHCLSLPCSSSRFSPSFLFLCSSSAFPLSFSPTYISTLSSPQSGLQEAKCCKLGGAIWQLISASERPLNSKEERDQINPSYYFHHVPHSTEHIIGAK